MEVSIAVENEGSQALAERQGL
ncbi:hypothetical protein ACFCVU_19020 [Peribacillus butanolivorans]